MFLQERSLSYSVKLEYFKVLYNMVQILEKLYLLSSFCFSLQHTLIFKEIFPPPLPFPP